MTADGRADDADETPENAQESDEQRRAREAAERAYVEGLIARGEAARPDEHGRLPPGATHEIVEWPEGELPVLRRRRFAGG